MNMLSPVTSNNFPAKQELTRVQTIERLTNQIVLNELGLPKFLYRTDLIPDDFSLLDKVGQRQHLNCATIEVSYNEGYPTFLSGLPIWDQMDHELDEDFILFQRYRDLTLSIGYRQLSAMPGALKAEFAKHVGSPNEELARGASVIVEEATFYPKQLMKRLHDTAICNFWYLRVKAYDMFILVSHRKQREQRLMRMETYHYDKAEIILDKLNAVMDDVMSPDKIKEMDPLDFIKAMSGAAELQRKALGVESGSGTKGASKDANAPPPGASVELVLRNIARTTQVDTTGASSGGAGAISEYVDNPEAVAAAQEFILRVNMGNRPQTISKGENGDNATARDEADDLAMVQETPTVTD